MLERGWFHAALKSMKYGQRYADDERAQPRIS